MSLFKQYAADATLQQQAGQLLQLATPIKFIGKDDRSVLLQLSQRVGNKLISSVTGQARPTEDLLRMLPKRKQHSYLDIGCGNGLTAIKLGKELKLTADQVHGTDINGWLETTEEVSSELDYFPIKRNWPLQTLSLVTLLSQLHHSREPEVLLQLVYTTLESGGLLLLEEYDAKTPRQVDLLKLSEYLALVARNAIDKYDDYYADFRSSSQWAELIKGVGFTQVNSRALADGRYLALYQKP